MPFILQSDIKITNSGYLTGNYRILQEKLCKTLLRRKPETLQVKSQRKCLLLYNANRNILQENNTTTCHSTMFIVNISCDFRNCEQNWRNLI